jgi:hypothetical protein
MGAAITVSAAVTLTAILIVTHARQDSDVNPTPTLAVGIEVAEVYKTEENDALFNVTMKNHATTPQNAVLVCRVTTNEYGSYFSNVTVTMNPQEIRTVHVTVDVPIHASWMPLMPSPDIDCYMVEIG